MRLKQRQLDFLSAALRHMRDAEHLLGPGEHTSLDQAYHLSGFGPECARKATLSRGSLDKALGHLGEDGNDETLEIALVMDAGAARYRLRG